MKFEIKNRWTGNVLFSMETESLKPCVEAAIKSCANLSRADLSCANLSGYISIGPIGSRQAYLLARWDDGKYIVHE